MIEIRISCSRNECHKYCTCSKTIDVRYDNGFLSWDCTDRRHFYGTTFEQIEEFLAFEKTSILGLRALMEQAKC